MAVFGQEMAVFVVRICRLHKGASVLVRNHEAFFGCLEESAFLAYDRPIRKSVEVHVQYAIDRGGRYLCRILSKPMGQKWPKRSEMKWYHAFTFYAAPKRREHAAYEIYQSRQTEGRDHGQPSINVSVRCKNHQDGGGRKLRRGVWKRSPLTFFANSLVKIYIYRKDSERREMRLSLRPVLSDDRESSRWTPQFSFYVCKRKGPGTSRVVVLESKSGEKHASRDYRYRIVSGEDREVDEEEHTIEDKSSGETWSRICSFHAFDAPISGSTRLSVQTIFGDGEKENARLTVEMYPKRPWSAFRNIFVLGVARFSYPHRY